MGFPPSCREDSSPQTTGCSWLAAWVWVLQGCVPGGCILDGSKMAGSRPPGILTPSYAEVQADLGIWLFALGAGHLGRTAECHWVLLCPFASCRKSAP